MPGGPRVELGISVLARARREGIGTLLLRGALGHARLVGALRLFMHCLAENDELMRLARRAGARIQVSHDEADGFIEVPCATAFSAAMELAAEHAGVAEYVCKAQRAAWRQALRR